MVKNRYQVGKTDVNVLSNPKIKFNYAGLFHSSKTWTHPKRVENTYEIIFVTEGKVYMKEGEKDIVAKAGDLFLLSPFVEHFGTKATSNVSFYWLHFSLNDATLPFTKTFFSDFDSAYLFKEILHYNNLPTPPVTLINSVLVHLLSKLFQMEEKSKENFNAKAEKIHEWIRANASAKLTLKDVSEHFGYSKDHITRICKVNFGVGAKPLINLFVLNKAKNLLSNTDKYVKEIAGELNFADDKAFISFFKYHEKCFPSEYRNRYGKIHINSK
jgi:AraC-like DNA-binding protein/quercetin dioxygenase-like cupin family protein